MEDRLGLHQGIVGLRAIAVLAVVIFHFFPTILPGGFIGVDIFFVISGFLISKSIYSDLERNIFSYAKFYERRVRRIIPAFIFVSLLTTIVCFFILLPYSFSEFSKSLLSSLFFSTNIFFYSNSNYFSPTAHELPLLHYWSLGVEEQFYILFPFLIVLCTKKFRKIIPIIIFIIFIVSLVSSEYVLRVSPPAAFYLLPYRAFELLFGALLALPQVRFPSSERIGSVAASVGLLIIGISLFKINERSPFPGFRGTIPCFGATLFIWGTHQQKFFISRLSNSFIPKFFGNISYSLYLIHWPVVVLFPKIFTQFGVNYNFYINICCFIFSILLAALIYEFVEQPFRVKRQFWNKKRLFTYTAISFVIVCSSSIFIILNQGFPKRIDTRINQMLAVLHYDSKPMFQSTTCFMEPEQNTSEYQTAICLPSKGPLVILWGDSHVSQYLWGLRPLFNAQGYQIGQITASGCAPAIGVYVASRPKCQIFNDFALHKIIETKPELVILGAAWSGSDEQLQGLERSILALQKANIKIVVFGPSMVYKDSVPTILANRMKKGSTDSNSGNDLDSDFIYRKETLLKKFILEQTNVPYISILDTICPNQICPMKVGEVPAHFDIVHQTREGSEYFASFLFPLIISAKQSLVRK